MLASSLPVNSHGHDRSRFTPCSCMLWFVSACFLVVCIGYLHSLHLARLEDRKSFWYLLGRYNQYENNLGKLFTDVFSSVCYTLWDFLPLLPTALGMWGLPHAAQWLHAFLLSSRSHRYPHWYHAAYGDARRFAPNYVCGPPGEWSIPYQCQYPPPHQMPIDGHHPWIHTWPPPMHSFPTHHPW